MVTDGCLPVCTAPVPVTGKALAASPDNIFPFFNRAFIIMEQDEDRTSSNLSQSETTALLLYNMGLCFHHKGVTRGGSGCLDRALEFYQLTFRTINEGQSEDEYSELSRFILLALATNMGHVYSHFFDTDEAYACREMLAELLASVSPDSPFMNEDEYLFFFLTMYVYDDFELVAAPAA